MEVDEEVIVPKNRLTVSELRDPQLSKDPPLPSPIIAAEALKVPKTDLEVEKHERTANENDSIVNGAEHDKKLETAQIGVIFDTPQTEASGYIGKKEGGPTKEELNSYIASKLDQKSDPKKVKKEDIPKHQNSKKIGPKSPHKAKNDATLKIQPDKISAASSRNDASNVIQNGKFHGSDEKLGLQEIEEKCHSLQDENESLRNQLEERERFLEDILNEIEEFKEKSRHNHNDLRVENIKLKEVNRSQVHKFSIERDFMLKENEFLKQRIEYLNEDLKFYTERQEKAMNSLEIHSDSNCCSSKNKVSETFDDKASCRKLLEVQLTEENELRTKISSLQIEIDASITLISTLEKDLENKNSLLKDANLKLEKSLEGAKVSQLAKEALENENKILFEDKNDLQFELSKLRLLSDAFTAKDDELKNVTEKLKVLEKLDKNRSVEMSKLSQQFSSISEHCTSLEKQNKDLKEKCKNMEVEKQEFVSRAEMNKGVNYSTQTEKSSFWVSEASVQTLEDISALETSIKDLNFQVEKLKRSYDEQLNTTQKLEAELDTIKGKYDTLLASKKSLEQKLQEKSSIILENESTIKGLKELLDRKTSDLITKTMDFQILQKTWDEKLVKIDDEQKQKEELLGNAVKKLQSELSNLFTDKQKVADALETSKVFVKSLEDDLSKERSLNAQNHEIIQELRKNCESEKLRSQVNEMKDKIEGLQNEILWKKSSMEKMEADLKKFLAKIEIQEREKSEIAAKHEEDILCWQKQVRGTKNDVEKLEKTILAKNSAIEQLENDMKNLSLECERREKEKEDITANFEEDILLWKNEDEKSRKLFENERLERNGIIQQLENDLKNHSEKINQLELENAETSAKFEKEILWWKTECEQNISQRCEIEAKLSNVKENCEQKLASQVADHEMSFQEMSRKYDEQIYELKKKLQQVEMERDSLGRNLEETCQQHDQKLKQELNRVQTHLKESHQKEVEEMKKFSDNREQLIKELEIKVKFLRETLESKEVNVTTAETGTETFSFDDDTCSVENTQNKLLESGNFNKYSPRKDFTNISVQNSTLTEFSSISREGKNNIEYRKFFSFPLSVIILRNVCFSWDAKWFSRFGEKVWHNCLAKLQEWAVGRNWNITKSKHQFRSWAYHNKGS